MEIRTHLAMLDAGERRLAEALDMVAERHRADADIRETAALLATWSRAHVIALQPLIVRHRASPTADADRLRAALFHDVRVGGLGALRDLHDLATLAHHVRLTWMVLRQAALGAHD